MKMRARRFNGRPTRDEYAATLIRWCHRSGGPIIKRCWISRDRKSWSLEAR